MKAKTEPIIAKKTSATPSDATVNAGSRKNRNGSIGAATWRSHAMNAAPKTTAAPKQASTSGSVQPRGVASMIA